MRAYVDTSFVYSLFDPDDTTHFDAVRIAKEELLEVKELYMGTNILSELVTLISQRISKKRAIEAIKHVRFGTYEVVNPDEKIFHLAERLFVSGKSKNISYSDYISFAIMQTFNLTQVFTFDSHFKTQGFKRVGID